MIFPLISFLVCVEELCRRKQRLITGAHVDLTSSVVLNERVRLQLTIGLGTSFPPPNAKRAAIASKTIDSIQGRSSWRVKSPPPSTTTIPCWHWPVFAIQITRIFELATDTSYPIISDTSTITAPTTPITIFTPTTNNSLLPWSGYLGIKIPSLALLLFFPSLTRHSMDIRLPPNNSHQHTIYALNVHKSNISTSDTRRDAHSN